MLGSSDRCQMSRKDAANAVARASKAYALERGPVEGEAASLNENAEPGRDHHGRLRDLQLRATRT
jgi:hypothetical protein